MVLNYFGCLMAEINRRIGKKETANEMFDEVIALTENNKEQEFITNSQEDPSTCWGDELR